MLPDCTHLYGTDYRWWRHHISDITDQYEGICWTQEAEWRDKKKKVDPAQWGIKKLKSDQERKGLSTTPGLVYTGQNSGYAAVNLALLLGAEIIILLGFDMMMDGNKRHWFGAHPPGMEMASCYSDFIANFRTINPKDYGIQIWNVTRKTDLKHFPLKNLERLCKDHHK